MHLESVCDFCRVSSTQGERNVVAEGVGWSKNSKVWWPLENCKWLRDVLGNEICKVREKG